MGRGGLDGMNSWGNEVSLCPQLRTLGRKSNCPHPAHRASEIESLAEASPLRPSCGGSPFSSENSSKSTKLVGTFFHRRSPKKIYTS